MADERLDQEKAGRAADGRAANERYNKLQQQVKEKAGVVQSLEAQLAEAQVRGTVAEGLEYVLKGLAGL